MKLKIPLLLFIFCLPILFLFSYISAKTASSNSSIPRVLETLSASAGGQMTIKYEWSGKPDLDTGTAVFGNSFGWSCPGNSPYVSWSGDNTESGGVETVSIDLAGAKTAKLWTTSFNIDLRAGWFSPANGSGPARVTVSYNGVTKQCMVSPGSQNGCASKSVGSVSVWNVSAGGDVSFSLNCKCASNADCASSGDQCNTGVCSSGSCVKQPKSGSCNDNNSCTTNDACQNGTCKGTDKTCDDGDLCTTDVCNMDTGCRHVQKDCYVDDCTTNSCDSKTGKCVNNSLSCNPNNTNECALYKCVLNSGVAGCLDDSQTLKGKACTMQAGSPSDKGVCNGKGGCICEPKPDGVQGTFENDDAVEASGDFCNPCVDRKFSTSYTTIDASKY